MDEQLSESNSSEQWQRCPICCNNSWTTILKLDGVCPGWWQGDNPEYEYLYINCNHCGFIKIGNIFSQEVYQKYYSTTCSQDGYAANYYLKRYEGVKSFITQHIDSYPKNLVVEVGANNCVNLNIFSECENLVAIEPSQAAKAYAAKHYPHINFFSMSLEGAFEKLGQYKNKAELVLCSHVLEHIEQPDVFMLQLDSFVAPEGYLYLEVPSLEAPRQYIPTSHLSFIHINHFSEHTLSLLCTRMGYEPVKIASCNLDDGWAVIRGLFKKVSASKLSNAYFQSYYKKYTHAAQSAAKKIEKSVSSSKQVVIWGASLDLWDIVRYLPTSVFEKVILVDGNLGKQASNIKGKPILSSEIVKELDPNKHLFFSATRSPAIHSSIHSSFIKLFPSSNLMPLFSEDDWQD